MRGLEFQNQQKQFQNQQNLMYFTFNGLFLEVFAYLCTKTEKNITNNK